MEPRDCRIAQATTEGLSDSQLCDKVVDLVWPFSEAEDTLEYLELATQGQQAVYTTMLFAREVDNGGYRQFFTNSSGMYYRHVLNGLKILNAASQHSALSHFLSFFPENENLVDRKKRQLGEAAMTQQQREEIKDYEKSVYRAGGFERTLVPLWTSYIDTHPEEFFK